MTKLYQFIFCFFVMQLGLQAQNIYKEAIITDAQKSVTAQQTLNIDDYMTMMHPNIIEMGGGKDLMKGIISSQIGTYSQMGVSIEGVDFDDPSDVVQAGEELHCTLSGSLKLKMGEDTFENPINLLAATSDEGANWTFVDLSFYNKNSLMLYLPDFNNTLSLPEK